MRSGNDGLFHVLSSFERIGPASRGVFRLIVGWRGEASLGTVLVVGYWSGLRIRLVSWDQTPVSAGGQGKGFECFGPVAQLVRAHA